MDRLLRLNIGKLFLSPKSRLDEVSDYGVGIQVPWFVSHCSRPSRKLTLIYDIFINCSWIVTRWQ